MPTALLGGYEPYGGLTAAEFVSKYWDPTGGYLSPAGTAYSLRGLPPSNLADGYHVYKWVKAWDPTIATITESEVVPAFEQPGGGMQYALQKTSIEYFNVQWLLDNGYIVDAS